MNSGRWLSPIAALVAVVATGALAQQSDAGIEELRAARNALAEAADFTAAIDPARQVVEILESTGGEALGYDVAYLARIQAGLGDYQTAELNYLRAIDLFRAENGEFAPGLIELHRALGRTYINARRFPEAIVTLEAAKDISRRNLGLFNVEQTDIIDDLTMAHIGAGETVQARDLQLERLENATRQYDDGDPRLIPFHSQLGDYYDRSRLRLSAREQYQAALALAEQNFGAGSGENLPPLRRLVASDLLLNEASDARDKLARLVEQPSEELPALELGFSLATLGDWALVHDDLVSAGDYYARAYRVLSEADDFDADAYFSTPRALTLVPPLTAVDRGTRRRLWTWGDLELEFDVSANGKVYDVSTVSMEPTIRPVQSDYVRRLREARFRPRLEAGRPVGTADVTYQQSFRYYVDD